MTIISKLISNSCVISRSASLSLVVSTNHTRRYSTEEPECFDIVVIGGGIVGAASARELKMRHCALNIALLEKEGCWAAHQTGHNSGVMHAGIYYKPGSLRAKLCVQGLNLAYEYCEEKGIKYSRCGKLIVATDRSEIPRLLDLYERGLKNGVKGLQLMDATELRELEPNAKGLQAIWSPNTGIVDWAEVCRSYVNDFVANNGKTYLNFNVKKFIDDESPDYPVRITDNKSKTVKAKYVLTCCGLHSDTIAILTGCPEEPKIIPFRGEYLYVVPQRSNIVKSNIYPVPDPRFPFLGVHATPTIDGRVILGPNAILSFAKEGYKWKDFNRSELQDIVKYEGFKKLAMKYAAFGSIEMLRSVFLRLQVKQIQKYIQNLTTADCERGPSGVRAQALAKDGSLIEDFVFDSSAGEGAISSKVLHCRNAPSPGATSSLAIAIMIADKMEQTFNLNY